MLSMSADLTNTDVNLQMINGDEGATAGGVEHALELMKFAEALASSDETALKQSREDLLAAGGAEVLVDAGPNCSGNCSRNRWLIVSRP